MRRSALTNALVAAAVLGLALVSTGCTNKAAASRSSADAPPALVSPSNPITVRYASYPGDTLWLEFAKSKGWLDELKTTDGIDLQTIEVMEKTPAYASGAIDFGDQSTTDAINGAGKGAPFKIVSNMYRSKGPFYLVAASKYKTVAELKGKKIALRLGTGHEVVARVILKKNGLDPDKDVTLVQAGDRDSDAPQAIKNGQVDAAILEEPFVTNAEKEGYGRLLAKGWDYLPTFHTGVLVASDTLIAEHPDAVPKLISFYHRVWSYGKANKEEWAAFQAQFLKLDLAVLKSGLAREDEIWDDNPKLDLPRLVETQKLQKDLGLQKQVYDVNKITNTTFVK